MKNIMAQLLRTTVAKPKDMLTAKRISAQLTLNEGADNSLTDRFGRHQVFHHRPDNFYHSLAHVRTNLEYLKALIISRLFHSIGSGAILFAVGPTLLGNVYTGTNRAKSIRHFWKRRRISYRIVPDVRVLNNHPTLDLDMQGVTLFVLFNIL